MENGTEELSPGPAGEDGTEAAFPVPEARGVCANCESAPTCAFRRKDKVYCEEYC